MGANLHITEKLQNYINDFGLKLHPIQQEIIDYNKTLGDIKRMQIDPTQCHFLHLIIKVSNIKNVLEIGTFTGLSALTISLALPDDGKLITLDKDEETNKIALHFFKKGKWVIENVISYYDPLIKPTKSNNHYFWSNFDIPIIEKDDQYDALMCVGTFTFGHVKPPALDEFIRITKNKGLICFTINEGIYEEYGFDKKIKQLKNENKWKEIEFFKSDYIASKDVNAWLGLYEVTK